MTFDFFNTSNLAFGKKIAQAFQTLEDKLTAAEDSVTNALQNIESYKQYGKLNYVAPVPFKTDSPARFDEILDVIDTYKLFKSLKYSNGLLSVEFVCVLNNNKINLITGSTELKEGYAFFKQSLSNSNYQRAIRFSSEDDRESGELLLFKFRILNDKNIILQGDTQSLLGYYAYDATQYRSLTKGEDITKLPYTATDYECVSISGNDMYNEVKLNGTTIFKGQGYDGRKHDYRAKRHIIVYMKPDDVLDGILTTGFKINYNF